MEELSMASAEPSGEFRQLSSKLIDKAGSRSAFLVPGEDVPPGVVRMDVALHSHES